MCEMQDDKKTVYSGVHYVTTVSAAAILPRSTKPGALYLAGTRHFAVFS